MTGFFFSTQLLLYACIQALHNLGAVAIVGGGAAALLLARRSPGIQRTLVWVITLGWVNQGVTGTLFGVASYYYDGRLPDIHGIALTALILKMACAVLGIILGMVYLRFERGWSGAVQRRILGFDFGLGVTALTAAAFLRWFS
ncbi:hypothetical protein Acife_2936 [Acidithiobacillus ferrivorans SS3]|uniref:Uncharacterized protein n=1 Tax=Acidithiobacillus ferrivorans SS3 TaxID=743299 RepID=G0JTP5_9PROT|nr:hypothetical protein [Acidithiobacillus ferrivorans]AEM49010.1 hypothetical protein Acife_2936 [Acidithiobacillus ferrivorans SS3]MBU2768659.1 hypothetical protein [Acidithiobacillus ferrivorans]MBU2852187.1 hypothetical protein [Acidithiobacillus ferrivorans]OFA14798.1 hypothetical protein A4U49_16245 [Acidithiobacillus ferrivorans]